MAEWVYRKNTFLSAWRCARCGQPVRDDVIDIERAIHYVKFPDEGGEVALFCVPCWPRATIAERLAAYAAYPNRNPQYPWQKIADTLWKDAGSE